MPLLSAPAERTDDQARTRVLDLLKQSGGVQVSSQRGLAESAPLSKTRTNEVLHQLANEGLVRVTTTSKGTVLQLT
jgi:DNA-binding IclR family transcriptional regulator